MESWIFVYLTESILMGKFEVSIYDFILPRPRVGVYCMSYSLHPKCAVCARELHGHKEQEILVTPFPLYQRLLLILGLLNVDRLQPPHSDFKLDCIVESLASGCGM